MGFHSQEEFVDYECAGSYQLPKNVDQLYAVEWKGWGDFLGVPLSFDDARVLVKQLGCTNKEDYYKLKQQGTAKYNDNDDIDIYRLPCKPDLYYKQVWISWEDFLGI